jgi:hypothetical protein
MNMSHAYVFLTSPTSGSRVASNTIGPRSLFTIFCAVLARHTFLKQKILKAQVGSTHTLTHAVHMGSPLKNRQA